MVFVMISDARSSVGRLRVPELAIGKEARR